MPNRIIKESICRSDTINLLKPFEEVLFYRLIVVCDDYGRFDGRPSVIKGYCFPLKDTAVADIKAALDKLVETGLVKLYEVQGKPVLQISTWSRHQQIRAKKSKYPAPDETCSRMQPNDLEVSQKKSSDCSGYQLISNDCNSPRNRESKYENRESYSRDENAGARAKTAIERFEFFWCCYPLDKNRYLAEQAYIGVISDGIYTEDDLVESAKNYAEAMRIKQTPERYIKSADNFLKDMVFEDYLPGKYKKPTQQKKSGFNDFERQDYDMEQLEKDLLSN